jgi:PAS domain S-box-containing protein
MAETPQKRPTPAISEAAMRSLERITDPFYTVDSAWRILYANPPAEAAFARRLDEIAGKVLWEAFPSSRDPLFSARLRQVARERRGQTFEALSPTLKRWIEVRVLPSGDGVAVYLKDVHERRLAENALVAAERRLSLLVRSIEDHLVAYDSQWRVTFVNDAAAREFGRSKEELLGCSLHELLPRAIGGPYWQKLLEAQASGMPATLEHHHDSCDRWFESRIYPTSEGVTVLSTDITARKRAEQALAERERALVLADRRKDEFLATLAHELRNPLAPIRQAAHLAGLPNATDAQVRWSREVVERQVRHMARLLDDLLDVSRVSMGSIPLRMTAVEVGTIVDTAIETARPLIDARRQRLQVHDGCRALCIHVDANRMAQVLSNLLSNAAKYTLPGGQIELAVRCDPSGLVFSVKDDGIGIAPGDLDTVFGMFTQLDTSVDRTEGGLGIGLALVKGIVELHGGSVQARSEGAGHGSEFVVRLPKALVVADPVPQAQPGAPALPRPLRIVIADDNDDAAETLAMLLALDGHEVHKANDGGRALALARELRPDVLLLDVGMPVMNGLDVATAVRAQAWSTGMRLVALTGWGKDEDRQRALAAGFDRHMTKPVDPDALRQLLGELTNQVNS